MVAISMRQQRGREIAAQAMLEWDGKLWHVPSQSGATVYLVEYDRQDGPICSCPDFEVHGLRCKHIYAVEIVLQQRALWEQQLLDEAERSQPSVYLPAKPKAEPAPQPKPKRPTYRQDWPAYNTAQVNEKPHFQKLLADLCTTIPEPAYVFGRPRLPLRDMVFCMAYKVYSTVSARRFMGDLADAHTKSYIERTPHYNSIFNYFEMADLTPYLRALIEGSATPMRAIETRFAVDSTGFSTCRYVRWFDAKYCEEKEVRDWLKVHVMCGVNTNIVTGVEITNRDGADCPQFKPLVNATARQFEIEEVSADKAYLSRANLEHTNKLGAVAYIPFKVNSTEGRGSAVWTRLYHYYCFQRDAFAEHYHRRSLVESTFAMIKAKFGATIRSKTDVAQANELLCKVLCHNICCVIQSMYELGIEAQFA